MNAANLSAPGQSWLQLEELTLAYVLSALVGLEREWRQKSAGMRTYTLVGVWAALFMLVSKYGVTDVLASGRVVVGPSRVTAQIVSCIGGGVIFVRRDVVRGLTTAASVWRTAALGMACGAGLSVLASATTAGHFVIIVDFRGSSGRCRRTAGPQPVCAWPIGMEAACSATPEWSARNCVLRLKTSRSSVATWTRNHRLQLWFVSADNGQAPGIVSVRPV